MTKPPIQGMTTDHKTLDSELAVFWKEITKNLPDSLERAALGDQKIFLAFKVAYPKIKEYLIKALLSDLVSKLEGAKRKDIGDAISNSEGVYIPDEADIDIEESFNSGLDKAIEIIKDKIEK